MSNNTLFSSVKNDEGNSKTSGNSYNKSGVTSSYGNSSYGATKKKKKQFSMPPAFKSESRNKRSGKKEITLTSDELDFYC